MYKYKFSFLLLKQIVCIVLFISFSNSAFSAPEAPEYLRTKNWSVEKVNGKNIVLTADIVFFNPNKIKAKLKKLNLDIFMNDRAVGVINQQEKVKIKAKSSFDIPIRISIDLSDAGINLSNILGLLSNQKFIIDLKGYLKANVFLLPFKVKIDEREEFSLKDFI